MPSTWQELWTLASSISIWGLPLIWWLDMAILMCLAGCLTACLWWLEVRRASIGRRLRRTLRRIWR